MIRSRAGRPETSAERGSPTVAATAIGAGRVMERGRAKAHRPLMPEVRRAAVERGLAAYERGDWYLAHEELEPAWMGTDDLDERALLSGLIKLAAAHVHLARGNPLGVRTNLLGARQRLATPGAAMAAGPAGSTAWIDVPALLADIDDRLVRVEPFCASPGDGIAGDGAMAAPSHDVAGPAGRFRGAPVAIPLIRLPRRSA